MASSHPHTSTSTSLCNHCGAPSTLRCSACQQVAYCSREHQQADWRGHKPACLHSRRNKGSTANWDKHVPKDGYVGTLRWGPDTTFRPLPEFRKGMVPSLGGWQDFFGSRLDSGSENEEGKLVLDPQMIDGLSFPLSFLWALRQLLLLNTTGSAAIIRQKNLVIGALGASDRAEERIFTSTNYWLELGYMFPGSHVELWLVGPEMSQAGSGKSEKVLKNMTVSRLRGTSAEFLDRFKDKDPIIVGFNTGFGSGDRALRESWKGDLRRILELNLLAIFTCANDYHDLKCEREIWEKELNAQYILFPRKNPFSAVTTTHLPGRQKDTWASANSYVYAIQGYRSKQHPHSSTAPPSTAPAVPHSAISADSKPLAGSLRESGSAAAMASMPVPEGRAEAAVANADVLQCATTMEGADGDEEYYDVEALD